MRSGGGAARGRTSLTLAVLEVRRRSQQEGLADWSMLGGEFQKWLFLVILSNFTVAFGETIH